jgi:hypothetical protein
MEGNPGLLILRTAALGFWIACVVFLLVPTHGKSSDRFHGSHLPTPKTTAARAL